VVEVEVGLRIGVTMTNESLQDWLRARPRTRAIICDIDDTICVQFDQPIADAIAFLAALDRSIEVHYVTARPEASRQGTEDFLSTHRLPGWRNLYFCPSWQSSREHKAAAMAKLAKQYHVVVSVGDHDEDEAASVAAGMPFVRVRDNHSEVWAEVSRLVAAVLEAK
jgi:phosphoglycolate phosphatase-like HAD superfamily hydrolase